MSAPISYFKNQSASITHGTTSKTAIVILSEFIIPTKKFRIKALKNYVALLAAWGNVHWQLRMNGTPIPPLEDFTDEIGTQITEVGNLNNDFPSASLLEIVAWNTDAANDYDAGISLKGEYFD